jgi:alpha-beta hydrolase superfamily lysophospholipase
MNWTAATRVKRTTLRCAAIFSVALCVASVAGCSWLDARQRAAIYRPAQNAANDFSGLANTDEVIFLDLTNVSARSVLTASGYARAPDFVPSGMAVYTSGWWLPSSKPDAPTLLYCHGVFRNLSHNYPKLKALRDAGFNVFAITYRGWPGTSAALPSEQSIYQDALRGWEEVKRRQPDPRKRALYGHSMGGGVAVELASRLDYPADYAALMLESTFTRLPDVAAEARWYGVLLTPLATQEFASIDKIARVKAPVLIRHGRADNTVPFTLGEELFKATGQPKRFVPFDGGSHSGLHREFPQRYRESVRAFWAEFNGALP